VISTSAAFGATNTGVLPVTPRAVARRTVLPLATLLTNAVSAVKPRESTLITVSFRLSQVKSVTGRRIVG